MSRLGPPSDIICPLTRQVFVDPVVASDGGTYERAAILNHVSRGQRSPLDNSVLENRFFPNVMIRQRASQWTAQPAASSAAFASSPFAAFGGAASVAHNPVAAVGPGGFGGGNTPTIAELAR
jgi:hypothetical protein